MWELLQKRLVVDPMFEQILRDAKAKGVTLKHFKRGSAKRPPMWGSLRLKSTGEIVGQDRYGGLIRRLIEEKLI